MKRLRKHTKNRRRSAYRRLQYFRWRIAHPFAPYRTFYVSRMTRRTAADPQSAIGGKWEELGNFQFDLLRSLGLQPCHTLLDFGCGSLRGGRLFIPFLEPGNYWGVDISPEIIAAAEDLLMRERLENRDPRILVIHDMRFDDYQGTRFDYILAQSVLTHMPLHDIREVFDNVKKVMHARTSFIATFHESETGRAYSEDMANFYYPEVQLRELAESNGLNMTILRNVAHPRGQTACRITLSSHEGDVDGRANG